MPFNVQRSPLGVRPTWTVTNDVGTIDASGLFPDGTTLNGVAGLREMLVTHPDIFVGTLTEKLLTYALGRSLEPADMPAVRSIVRGSAKDGYRFSSIVRGIVTSVPFQMRRAR